MNKQIIKRVKEEAEYMINTKRTIRDVAEYFCVSKSTVHKDIQERLPNISPILNQKVKKIVKEHLKTRHIKGGEKTKELYSKKRG